MTDDQALRPVRPHLTYRNMGASTDFFWKSEVPQLLSLWGVQGTGESLTQKQSWHFKCPDISLATDLFQASDSQSSMQCKAVKTYFTNNKKQTSQSFHKDRSASNSPIKRHRDPHKYGARRFTAPSHDRGTQAIKARPESAPWRPDES